MKKYGDIKDNYIGNVYGELEPIISYCAIPYCAKDITSTDDFFEHVHSDDILCSMRCVELHWAESLTDTEK